MFLLFERSPSTNKWFLTSSLTVPVVTLSLKININSRMRDSWYHSFTFACVAISRILCVCSFDIHRVIISVCFTYTLCLIYCHPPCDHFCEFCMSCFPCLYLRGSMKDSIIQTGGSEEAKGTTHTSLEGVG